MQFPYIRQQCNHICHTFSFPICYILLKLESESRSCNWEGLVVVTVHSDMGLPSFSSAYRERRLLPLRCFNWCICKQHYRWKRLRRCLASINPICVLTHFKCARRCTHEMRETLQRSNGCKITQDFSRHTKEMSSQRDLHSVKRKTAPGYILLGFQGLI